MNRLLVKLAITAAAGSVLFFNPTNGQILPPAPKAPHVEITKGPELEIGQLLAGDCPVDYQQPWRGR